MNFYVITCDKYLHLIKGFIYMFYKNWPLKTQKLIFLGYKKPNFNLPNHCTFVSLGEDPGVEEWSTPLVDYFQNINDEYFGWGFENLWLNSPMNALLFLFLIDCFENKEIEKVCLYEKQTSKTAKYKLFNRQFGIYRFLDNSDNKFDLMTNIITKKYLLKFLIPHFNPWEIEQFGNTSAKYDKDAVTFLSIHSYIKLVDVYNRNVISKFGRLGIKQINKLDFLYILQTYGIVNFEHRKKYNEILY